MASTPTTNLGLNQLEYSDMAEIPTIYNADMQKIDAGVVLKNQGSENAGKFMVVNNSGIVTPTTVPFANGGTY